MTDGSDEFRLVSPPIDKEGKLPRKYTGEGQGAKKNLSPPLEWYNMPEGTKSLALIVQDLDGGEPDGPMMPWAHWVVINIPPTLKGLPEGFSGKEEDMGGDYAGIKEGNNDWKIPGWSGPMLPPPVHSHGHRFEFKLYALDDQLHLGNKVTKDKVLEAIEGHVLGEAVLMATF
ncbi:OLC1v1033668C1 [Oldenlandia corymbosa var. corymbosa]|uniref:OLC1v1033668C1 n=1 Tax=Oldenlandia corymbosa var. corymbosa TaxID=529605 RepID=A0AAV1CPJ2_OLDCO|nr:OLC1v1033668C1 [Oldenlandia corymbosa var. corymbosa]